MGYNVVILKNPDFTELEYEEGGDYDYEKQNLIEQEFIKNTEEYKNIKYMMGINYLKGLIDNLVGNKINEDMPKIKEQIHKEYDKIMKKRESYFDPYSDRWKHNVTYQLRMILGNSISYHSDNNKYITGHISSICKNTSDESKEYLTKLLLNICNTEDKSLVKKWKISKNTQNY